MKRTRELEMVWPHKTSEDLALAGYKLRGWCTCPKCGAVLEMYQIPASYPERPREPGQFPVFLDPVTHYPHLMLAPEHMDPPWRPPVDGKTAAAGRDE